MGLKSIKHAFIAILGALTLSLIVMVFTYSTQTTNTAEEMVLNGGDSLAEIPIFDNEEDRYEYIFGAPRQLYRVSAPPRGYESASRAASHMTTITVPVWKYVNGNKRVSSEMSLTVNKKLAENVKAIFKEIHELDEQFCVTTLSGFQYRRLNIPWFKEKSSKYLSHHSFGTAIDINYDYNLYYHYTDKRDKNSPYYISENVIAVFEKYGWSWGGNFEIGLDTMHFQYLGLTCME